MSEREEFEEGFKTKPWLTDGSSKYWIGWQACAERKDKEIARRDIIIKLHASIIEQQAEELAALRGFANDLLTSSYIGYIDEKYLSMKMRKYFLLDEDSNPTKLLTGEE